jgi:hypothetical protein
MLERIRLSFKKIWRHKFKILLFIFVVLAIVFGIIICAIVFFNNNFFCIDVSRYQLLASLGIILSALIASFAVLTNIEVTKNNEEYKNLKYIQIQFMLLDRYINFSIGWLEQFRDQYWDITEDCHNYKSNIKLLDMETKNENLRLEEFINEIYNIRREFVSKDNSFIYKSDLTEDFGVSSIVTSIEEIYHFKNVHKINKSNYNDFLDSLTSLSLTTMSVENKILDKLKIFEKDID